MLSLKIMDEEKRILNKIGIMKESTKAKTNEKMLEIKKKTTK